MRVRSGTAMRTEQGAVATILLTYEFGSGLGHVNRLIAVALRLAPIHRLVFAVPNVEAARPAISRICGERGSARAGVPWPGPADPGVRKVPTCTFADVLRLFSYDDPAVLGPAVERWRLLVDDVRPDLIIADFAPTLRLAIGDAIPTVVVGNGYTVPPPGRVLQPMRPWVTVVPAISRANEARVLETVNRLRAAGDGDAVDHLADLFSGQATFVCTLREFDPYAPHRRDAVTFPFNVPNVLAGPPGPERNGPTIFVYLPASHPHLDMVLAALNRLGHKTHLYVANTDWHALAKRCASNIRILTEPADFAKILPQVQLLIHHAGLGTAYGGLASGTPQLVLPLNLEHLVTSRALAGAGVAQGFNHPPPDRNALEISITSLLENPVWMERAMAYAATLVRDSDPLAKIVAACEHKTDRPPSDL